ncbi:hypothetical protein GCK72_008166 [Caenorhabditis remanei]|uniref:Uncharacterized protein n=1 Tax=Caenorhabditis remanei TaxID=31234 RepID=A0A6A5GYX0_CAERE|nr:hypothetical protein GCK72_008166 [Caenorhabditis remanei]KAF1759921.1 hypothetical protein GCK72_008166 [Caenorhabditis remanei]
MEEPSRRRDFKKSASAGTTKGGITGGVAGAAKNAAQYIIKQGGTRWYNGVNIFDKTVRNAKGYPKWFARIDMPTVKNPQAHINVNKAVTGLKDPHMAISTTTAQNAATAGTVLNFLNKAAPVLTVMAVAYDGYQIGKNAMDDREKGSTRNTTKKVVTTAATWGGGYGGAATGGAIGTSLFPGVGTLIGAIIGGVAGGIGGNVASNAVADAAMDKLEYDICYPKCTICRRIFECRKFETGARSICDKCSEKCSWCGTMKSDDSESDALETVNLEEGMVKLCSTCLEVLKKEVLAELEKTGKPKPESSEFWNCKRCGYDMKSDFFKTSEEHLILCKTCRDNDANDILEQKTRDSDNLNPNCVTIRKEMNTCKWCDEDFLWTEADGAKDFCPECEEKRPKKK